MGGVVGRVYWPGEESTCVALGRRVPVLAWGREYLCWLGEGSTCIGLGRRGYVEGCVVGGREDTQQWLEEG